MIDFRACTIEGVGKCRAIWDDGTLHIFKRHGNTLEPRGKHPCEKPRRVRFFTNTWKAGDITIKTVCMTCGGWWRVAMIPADRLIP